MHCTWCFVASYSHVDIALNMDLWKTIVKDMYLLYVVSKLYNIIQGIKCEKIRTVQHKAADHKTVVCCRLYAIYHGTK